MPGYTLIDLIQLFKDGVFSKSSPGSFSTELPPQCGVEDSLENHSCLSFKSQPKCLMASWLKSHSEVTAFHHCIRPAPMDPFIPVWLPATCPTHLCIQAHSKYLQNSSSLRGLFFPKPLKPPKSTVVHLTVLRRGIKILPRIGATFRPEGRSLEERQNPDQRKAVTKGSETQSPFWCGWASWQGRVAPCAQPWAGGGEDTLPVPVTPSCAQP